MIVNLLSSAIEIPLFYKVYLISSSIVIKAILRK